MRESDTLFVSARDAAIDELKRLHANRAVIGGFVDLAHRVLAQATTEHQRQLSSRRFRQYTEAIVEALRRVV